MPRSSEKSIASRKILPILHKNFAIILQSLRGGSSDDDQGEGVDDEEMPLLENGAEEEEEDDDDDMMLGLDDEDFLLAGEALDSGDFQEETVVDRSAFSKTPRLLWSSVEGTYDNAMHERHGESLVTFRQPSTASLSCSDYSWCIGSFYCKRNSKNKAGVANHCHKVKGCDMSTTTLLAH
jgi:hypothetical protein